MAHGRDPNLRVALEHPIPDRVPAGSTTAAFCYGHCFLGDQPVAGLELIAGGRAHQVSAFGMPRRDLLAWLHDARSYHSGFWATIPLHAPPLPGKIEVQARVRLADGQQITAPLATIAVDPPTAPAPPLTGDPDPETIVICLATFEPDLELLAAQLDSIRDQTDRRWICLVGDGGSAAERLSEIERLIDRDERFVLIGSDRRLDPYRNFERLLAIVPSSAELVALCDQDDRWHADKLATLRAALGSARLVYSDMRMVDPGGRVIRASLWGRRRNDYRNLASVMVANTMPGAAMLLRREVVEQALPFPSSPAVLFHDHWLALVALAGGEVNYVDRALYDWVQHPASTSRAEPGSEASRWRAAYFCGYVPRQVQAVTLLSRLGPELRPGRRRALQLMVAAERSPLAFMWLTIRPLRRLAGRGETLGEERTLVRGLVWRRLVGLAGRIPAGRLPASRRPARLTIPDASFPDPPALDQPRLRRWRAGL